MRGVTFRIAAVAATLVLASHVRVGHAQAPPPDKVREAQIALKTLGLDPGLINGHWGGQTVTALRRFQRTVSLPETGRLDEFTLERLGIRSISVAPISSQPLNLREIARGTSAFGITLRAHPILVQGRPNPPPNQRQAQPKSPTDPSAGTPANPQGSVSPPAADPTAGSPVASGLLISSLLALVLMVWLGRALFRRRAATQLSASPSRKSSADLAAEIPAIRVSVSITDRIVAHQPVERGGSPQKPIDFKRDGDRAWVTALQNAKVAGLDLQGLVYVGNRLAPGQGHGTRDNCLIDASLPVAAEPDTAGQHMNYWPSYETMQPASRRALLEWLASDRIDPNAYIGYVFVYLYGLERRVILEHSTVDRPIIKLEVQRLLDIYGTNRSFHRYGSELLSAIELLELGPDDDPTPVYGPVGGGLPASVQVAVGRRLRDGRAIEPEWLLACVMSHPDTRVSVAAHRAFDQVKELFEAECRAQFRNGLRFDGRHLPARRVEYRAASGTFLTDLTSAIGPLPDVSQFAEGLAIGRKLLAACIEKIESYSRFAGRSPELVKSLRAVSLLPSWQRRQLAEDLPGSPLAWLEDVAHRNALASIHDAFSRTFGQVPDKLTPARLRDLADVLAKFGIGLVPDPRFALRATVADSVLLFSLERPIETIEKPSAAYRVALLTLSLSMLVAQADGTVDDGERDALERIRQRLDTANPFEQLRLAADLRWLELHPLDLTALRSRLAVIAPSHREMIANLLVDVAAQGGLTNKNEVALLERIYRQLHLDPERLYAGLHRALPLTSAPIQGAQPNANISATGYSIPPEAAPLAPSSPLSKQPAAQTVAPNQPNKDRVAAVRAETFAITAVLDGVFGAEANSPQEVNATESTIGPSASGMGDLGPKYIRMLQELGTKESWPRAEFEGLARKMGLMPGAAMEELNTWSSNKFDDIILEGDDPILFNRTLVTKNLAEAAE